MEYLKRICKKYKKVVMLMALSILCGIIVEVLYNLPINKEEDYQYIPIENVELDNFHLVNGNTFVTHGGEASITIPIEKQFVDKF